MGSDSPKNAEKTKNKVKEKQNYAKSNDAVTMVESLDVGRDSDALHQQPTNDNVESQNGSTDIEYVMNNDNEKNSIGDATQSYIKYKAHKPILNEETREMEEDTERQNSSSQRDNNCTENSPIKSQMDVVGGEMPLTGGRGCGMEFTDINYVMRKIDRELDKPYQDWRKALEEHGRLKVKSTAEQLEAKRKEREKKLKIYNAATSKIFEKKQNGELDEELLNVTGEVLAVNPDFYTLWNVRKETFLELKNVKDCDELQKMFISELHFLESCLKINPKSYGTWHHRCFIMDTMPKPDWERELQLCNQFLQYDERNFHCWDYRRFVVKRANVSPELEFEYSYNKISNNFSNYSSWHYRSKLLPLLYPDKSQPMGVSEQALLKEYELVQNGFFTDPDDQSNWFYHRWLMGRGEQTQTINLFYVSRVESRILISFTKPIQVGSRTSILVQCNSTSITDATWHNQNNDDTYSTLWIADGIDLPVSGDCYVEVKVIGQGCDPLTSSLTVDGLYQVVTTDTKKSSRFSQDLSAVKSETLQQELESVGQLMELETDNKWAVLTVVLLMKALDPIKYREEIMTHLDTLIALDFTRLNYYKDLKSKFMIENIIDEDGFSKPGSSLQLRNCYLTKLYHLELLPLVSDIDLSENSLHEVRHFTYLQSVKSLNLSGNVISSCEGLQGLPMLETLILSDNDISCVEDLEPLASCRKLVKLDISGNPVCRSAGYVGDLMKLLQGVNIVCGPS